MLLSDLNMECSICYFQNDIWSASDIASRRASTPHWRNKPESCRSLRASFKNLGQKFGTDKQTDRQTDRQTDKLRVKPTDKQKDKQTDKNILLDRQTCL